MLDLVCNFEHKYDLKHNFTQNNCQIGTFQGCDVFEDIQNQIQNHSEVEKSQGDAFEKMQKLFQTWVPHTISKGAP